MIIAPQKHASVSIQPKTTGDDVYMMSFEVIVELLERGAAARARGAGREENPFLRIAAMPGTSDQADHWKEKREAWQFGWAIENAYRTACFDDRAA